MIVLFLSIRFSQTLVKNIVKFLILLLLYATLNGRSIKNEETAPALNIALFLLPRINITSQGISLTVLLRTVILTHDLIVQISKL